MELLKNHRTCYFDNLLSFSFLYVILIELKNKKENMYRSKKVGQVNCQARASVVLERTRQVYEHYDVLYIFRIIHFIPINNKHRSCVYFVSSAICTLFAATTTIYLEFIFNVKSRFVACYYHLTLILISRNSSLLASQIATNTIGTCCRDISLWRMSRAKRCECVHRRLRLNKILTKHKVYE